MRLGTCLLFGGRTHQGATTSSLANQLKRAPKLRSQSGLLLLRPMAGFYSAVDNTRAGDRQGHINSWAFPRAVVLQVRGTEFASIGERQAADFPPAPIPSHSLPEQRTNGAGRRNDHPAQPGCSS